MLIGNTTFYQAKRGIVQDGLVLNIDAGVRDSVNGTGIMNLAGSGSGVMISGAFVSTDRGGSIEFSATGQYINLSPLVPSSGFTFESVFQWRLISVNIGSLITLSYQYPVKGWNVRQYDNFSRIVVGSDNGVETFITGVQPISTGIWYHLSVVQNTGNCTIYINGILDTSKNLQTPILDSSIPTYIGRRDSGGGYLLGKVALSRIYNRALSSGEVYQNFQATRYRFGV